jgi:hypothetical protein
MKAVAPRGVAWCSQWQLSAPARPPEKVPFRNREGPRRRARSGSKNRITLQTTGTSANRGEPFSAVSPSFGTRCGLIHILKRDERERRTCSLVQERVKSSVSHQLLTSIGYKVVYSHTLLASAGPFIPSWDWPPSVQSHVSNPVPQVFRRFLGTIRHYVYGEGPSRRLAQ